MPVVRISALPQSPDVDLATVLKRLCVQLAEVEGGEPRHWWATWQTIEPGHFVEGDVEADVQPAASHGPIVEIQAFTGRSPELIEAVITAAADLLAAELHLEPGDVFITWTELQPGRVHTGGDIRR